MTSNSVASGAAVPEASTTCARGIASECVTVLRRRLPQPVADLVVEGLDLARLHDVHVVAQAVEQLRAVGLRVDRLQLVVLDEDVAQAALDHRAVRVGSRTGGMVVEALHALPDAGHRAQRAEVRERVGIAVGLGVDVVAVRFHVPCLYSANSGITCLPRSSIERMTSSWGILYGLSKQKSSSQPTAS